MSEVRQPRVFERLADAGLRVTKQRVRVLEELAREPHDVTAQELHRRLRDDGERIGLATVYRTRRAFVEAGLDLALRPRKVNREYQRKLNSEQEA